MHCDSHTADGLGHRLHGQCACTHYVYSYTSQYETPGRSLSHLGGSDYPPLRGFCDDVLVLYDSDIKW